MTTHSLHLPEDQPVSLRRRPKITRFFSTMALLFCLNPAVHAKTITLDPARDWNAQDQTARLQEILSDPECSTVVIPPGPDGAAWITGPLTIHHDNTAIHLKENAVLKAAAGAFPNGGHSLISAVGRKNIRISGEKNAALVMNLEEYAQLNKAEWRHNLNFYDCEGVTVEKITLKGAGGDGIYLGTRTSEGEGYCSQVVIREVVTDGVGRNGISIISAKGVHISDSVFKNTRGMGSVAERGPWAGIDLEPNNGAQIIQDIVIERCVFSDNAGHGLVVDGYGMFKTKSKEANPISIAVKESRFLSNEKSGVAISGIPASRGEATRITFEDCVMEGNQRAGISSQSKAHAAGTLSFSNCTLKDNATGEEANAQIFIGNVDPARKLYRPEPAGNIVFDRVRIEASSSPEKAPQSLLVDGTHGPVSDVTGSILPRQGDVLFKMSGNLENIEVSLSGQRAARKLQSSR